MIISKVQATTEDLYRVPEHGKAEMVHGEVITMSPTGARPGKAATRIAARLDRYEEEVGGGTAFGDNVGFLVQLPVRHSFSPDAAWFTGDIPTDSLKFAQGAPVFAVEVRSEGDYGPQAEQAISQKIADYFAAGTLVVWDVDLLSSDVIKKYRADAPDSPELFQRGSVANAEPAVPGWSLLVDILFR